MVEKIMHQDVNLDWDAAWSVVTRIREEREAGRDPLAELQKSGVAAAPAPPPTAASPATPRRMASRSGGGDGVIDFIEFCAFFRSMPALQFWSVIETPSKAKKGEEPKSPRPWAALN